jgi:hypothetical protein
MDIVSGAGHDACWINDVAPAAMVMCPCVDGLSHNEAEEITPEWATAGADVLFHAVVETAEIWKQPRYLWGRYLALAAWGAVCAPGPPEQLFWEQ